jgi:hypothetical protein
MTTDIQRRNFMQTAGLFAGTSAAAGLHRGALKKKNMEVMKNIPAKAPPAQQQKVPRLCT